MSDFVIENGVLTKYQGTNEHIVVPNGVTAIGEKAFFVNGSLQSVTLPEGVTNIGECAFACCTNLMTVNLPESLISIGKEAFYSCSSLTDIEIPENVTDIGGSALGKTPWLMSQGDFVIFRGNLLKYQGSDEHVEIPDHVKRIDNYAFYMCKNMKSITIPPSVLQIGEGAFSFCESLTSLEIPEGVTVLEESIFSHCFNLQSVMIPQTVIKIGEEAFSHCKALTTLSIPESVTEIGKSAFGWCEKLQSMIIPAGVVIINESTFIGCKNMKKVMIPGNVTEIGKEAFCGCDKLSSATLQDGVMKIGVRAFKWCENLKSVTIPESVQKIGTDAFEGCDKLVEITTGIKLKDTMFGLIFRKRLIMINDCGMLPNRMKPYAAIGFAEKPEDLQSERGKSHLKYIKSNVSELIDLAFEYVSLLRLMLETKLLKPEMTEAYLAKAQRSGNAEIIAMLLDYQQNKLTAKEKKKASEKAETREEKITEFVFGTENIQQLKGKVFVVTGKLKTFSSRDEFKACLDACGAGLSETLNEQTNYLITNTPNSGTAKNKKAEQLGVKKLTEDEFNQLIERTQP